MANDIDPRSILADLSELSATLNHQSDQLARSIAEFEKLVFGLRLGVEVTVVKPFSTSAVENEETHDSWSEEKRLGFCKIDQGWGLYVIESRDGEQIGEPRLLRDASREDRVQAVRAFPALLMALREAATEEIHDVMLAADAAGVLVSQLQQKSEGKAIGR